MAEEYSHLGHAVFGKSSIRFTLSHTKLIDYFFPATAQSVVFHSLPNTLYLNKSISFYTH